MKQYALYDTYETEIEPGELICTSDDYAEIVKAAKLRKTETDGFMMKLWDMKCTGGSFTKTGIRNWKGNSAETSIKINERSW